VEAARHGSVEEVREELARRGSTADFTPNSRGKMAAPSGMEMSVTVADTAVYKARVGVAAASSVPPECAVRRGRGAGAASTTAPPAGPGGKRGRRGGTVAKAEAKAEVKVEDKAEPKAEAKVEAKAEPKAEAEVEAKTKSETKANSVASSARSRKRRLESPAAGGTPAKRHSSSSSSASNSPALRAARAEAVMFTGFISERDSALVEELGGRLTDAMAECSVLVAESMKRTAKLLCMAARGVPIVSARWLVECKAAKRFVDPWRHLLRDAAVEKKWSCRLEETLRQAARRPLLQGLSVHVTLQVSPPPQQFREFIEAAGGTFVPKIPTAAHQDLYCVGAAADKAAVSRLRKLGVPVMDKEWLLTGIIKHQLDPGLVLQ